MRAWLAILMIIWGAGCAIHPPAVEWRVEPHRNYYAQPKAVVFEALLLVLDAQGYEITRSGAATGVIEAQGGLLESRVRGKARQYFVQAKLRDLGAEETGVAILVHEAREGDFKTGATRTALARHGRYASIFASLEARLGEGSALPSAPPGPARSR